MRRQRLNVIVLALGCIWLSGCATGNSDPRSDGAICPPVVEYPAEFLDRAADEINSLPADSAIERMIGDYSVMRAQSRACR